jgi:hypothetical protein
MHGKKSRTLAEAYAAHGAVRKNTRWSWSAWSEHFDCAVVTVWRDSWVDDEGTFNLGAVVGEAGNSERREIFARVEPGDRVRVVLCEAVDARASPRQVRVQYADDRPFELMGKDEAGGIRLRPDMAGPRFQLR